MVLTGVLTGSCASEVQICSDVWSWPCRAVCGAPRRAVAVQSTSSRWGYSAVLTGLGAVGVGLRHARRTRFGACAAPTPAPTNAGDTNPPTRAPTFSPTFPGGARQHPPSPLYPPRKALFRYRRTAVYNGVKKAVAVSSRRTAHSCARTRLARAVPRHHGGPLHAFRCMLQAVRCMMFYVACCNAACCMMSAAHVACCFPLHMADVRCNAVSRCCCMQPVATLPVACRPLHPIRCACCMLQVGATLHVAE
jgi:hypothetical protein